MWANLLRCPEAASPQILKQSSQLAKDKFFEDVNDATARAKASAWYEVAYEGGQLEKGF